MVLGRPRMGLHSHIHLLYAHLDLHQWLDSLLCHGRVLRVSIEEPRPQSIYC